MDKINNNINIIYKNSIKPNFAINDLKIIYLNIRSLRNKLYELENYIETLTEKPDLIILTEIWIYKEENSKYNIQNYNCFFTNRESSQAGGVCIFIKSNIIANNIFSHDDGESSILGINLVKFKLNIFSIYKSPSANNEIFFNKLDLLLSSYKNNIVIGDFNFDLLQSNINNEKYVNVIQSNGHTILNKISKKFSTRVTLNTHTIIDHIITDCLKYSYTISLSDLFISDHKVISLSITLALPINRRNTVLSKQVTNYKKIRNDKQLDQLNNLTSMDELIQKLQHIIKENTTTIRLPNSKKKRKVWITTDIVKMIQKRDKLYSLKQKNPHNAEICSIFKKIKISIQHQIELAKKEYYNSFFLRNEHKPKIIWNGIHELIYNTKKTNEADNNILIVNNITIKDPEDIANCFNEFFTSITSQFPSNHNPVSTATRYNIEAFSIRPVPLEFTIKIINNLKTSSANGHDNISAKFLKEFINELAPVINNTINQHISEGSFPDSLKKAKIKPIFKAGQRTSPNNHRPIAVLPNLAKLYEITILTQFQNFLLQNDIIDKQQFGFVSKSSTTSACSQLISGIQHDLDKGEQVICLFIDIRKAFDCVDHHLLLHKLRLLGLNDKTFKIFESFLVNRVQYVRINDKDSQTLQIKAGVPQGAILSPTLFNFFINDIFRLKLNGSLQLYADDAVIKCTGKDITQIADAIEQDLHTVNTWFQNNKLQINIDKTKYIAFKKRSTSNSPIQISLMQVPVEQVKTFTYLGLHIDEDLSWDYHLKKIKSSISSTAFAMRRIRNYVSTGAMWMMYNGYITPKLQYLNPLWNSAADYKLRELETIQNKIVKNILNLPRLHPSNLLYSPKTTPSLRSLNQFLSIMYIFNIKHDYIKHNFTLKTVSTVHSHNTRSSENYYILFYRTNKGLNSIISKGLRLFNNLPQNIKNLNKISSFKKELKDHLNIR